MYVSLYVDMRVCVCVCVCARAYVRIDVCVHARVMSNRELIYERGIPRVCATALVLCPCLSVSLHASGGG